MERENEEHDQISELPTHILHQILCRLPREEAAKTSVLSKEWNSVWKSYPIQIFIHDFDNSDVAGFAESVDKCLQRFKILNLLIRRFSFHFWFYHNLEIVSRIDQWMESILNTGVQELRIQIGSKLKESKAQKVYVLPEKMFSLTQVNGFGSKFYSLGLLCLAGVGISNSIVRDIVSNCPNIYHLCLYKVSGLESLVISKHYRLRLVRVWIDEGECEIKSVNIDAPNLRKFDFTSQNKDMPCDISLTSCHNHLTYMSLAGFLVADDLFHSFLSQFSRLETLKIVECQLLQRIKIASEQLRNFHIFGCKNIKTLEIDAPNLSLFKWQTYSMPKLLSKNVPCPMEISFVFRIGYGELSTSWFHWFSEFLWASKQQKDVRMFCGHKKTDFDLDELEDVVISPPVKVNHLKIISMINRSSMDFVNLIDALLWSCHPNKISVSCNASSLDRYCMKALCEKIFTSEDLTCCDFSQVKCWRHDLKSAKLIRFGDIEDTEHLLKWNYLLDNTMPSLGRSQALCFELAWNC